ncbi:MAG: LysR family transcriptional regulator, partial [Betaproteobacteria bacterium]|nr:LysR family transcriptional regulator [Betaproteobacteria bacterium]
MRLTQIRDFLAVVECGGVRAASRKLGVAQPTISKSVRDLEIELHVQLVGRTSRGIALRPAGRAFHTRALAAAAELRRAEEEAAQTGHTGAGSVTFSMGPVGVIAVLPEALTRFRRQFPLARIRVVEGYGHLMLSDVRNESLDFAFGQKATKGLDAAIRFRPLFQSPLVICARKGHPLGRARRLRELAGAEWMATGNNWEPGAAADRMFRSAGLEVPHPAVQSTNHVTAMSLLAHSDMLSLTQLHILERAPSNLLLQEIKVTETIPAVTVGL